MKYTTEDALKEINRRAEIILKNRERRMLNALATTAGVTLVALFAVIGKFSAVEIPESQSMYGAFILSSEAAGYVLTATLGFILGVCVTFLVKRLKK